MIFGQRVWQELRFRQTDIDRRNAERFKLKQNLPSIGHLGKNLNSGCFLWIRISQHYFVVLSLGVKTQRKKRNNNFYNRIQLILFKLGPTVKQTSPIKVSKMRTTSDITGLVLNIQQGFSVTTNLNILYQHNLLYVWVVFMQLLFVDSAELFLNTFIIGVGGGRRFWIWHFLRDGTKCAMYKASTGNMQ